jgi:NADH:ubiquinone oxidoreductase subunit 6 (subunit J)
MYIRPLFGFFNYFILALILVFGLLAVLVRNQSKKLTYLFLMFLCTGILSYLLFAGVAFMIPGAVLLLFNALLFLFVFNQEFFGFGVRPVLTEIESARKRVINTRLIANLVISIVFCLGLVYLLFLTTGDYYQGIEYVEDFKTAGVMDIIDDIGSNYIPVIFIIAGMLLISIIWFIGILKNRGSEH